MQNTETPTSSRLLDRGLQVIETLGKRQAQSLADLHIATGLAKPTLLRILKTLINRGWVHRRFNDGRYLLGPSLIALEKNLPLAGKITRQTADHLHKLHEITGYPSDFALILSPGRLEILDSTRRWDELQIFPHVVNFAPSIVHSALGRTILASSSNAQLEDHIKAIVRSQTRNLDASDLRNDVDKVIKQTRRRGYSVRKRDHWGRAIDKGVPLSAIALAVPHEKIQCAINLVWPRSTMAEEEFAKLHLAALKTTVANVAEEIDEMLGEAKSV